MIKKLLTITVIIIAILGIYMLINTEDVSEDGKNVIDEQNPINGRIVFGHEVRTFQPCGEGKEITSSLWIIGSSEAYEDIQSAYEQEMTGTGPYAPMYAEVVGREVAPPDNGFGADYESAIQIDTLVLAESTGSCKNDFIVLENIRSGEYIDASEPLIVRGTARGNWFFEADFPVQILDNHANVLANGYASAEGEWMTQDFVTFSGTIQFSEMPQENTFGKLVLHKDNPSDLRELDDQLEVLIYFGSGSN